MNINTVEQSLFSPYGRKYCNYFYVLMIISLIYLLLVVVSTIYLLFKNKIKPYDGFLALTLPFLMYFTNRLSYSMCMGSLQ